MGVDFSDFPFALVEQVRDKQGNVSSVVIAMLKDLDKAIELRNVWNYKLRKAHNNSKVYILFDLIEQEQVR